MEWLSNHWVFGVGSGIICGLVVMLVVHRLFSGRDQFEYHQNVAIANNEILQAIRPAIAQKVVPSNAMLDALFSATARKYGVDSRNLLPKAGFANELMKEVIDNALLSSQQKVEFCELVAEMKQPDTAGHSKRGIEVITVTTRADTSDPSVILGLTTALMAFMVTVFFYMNDKAAFMTGGQLMKILPMLVIVTVVPIATYMLHDLIRQLFRPRREFEEEMIVAPGASASSSPSRDLSQLEGKPAQATP